MARLLSTIELDWRGTVHHPDGRRTLSLVTNLSDRRGPHGEVGVLFDAYQDAERAPSGGACGALWSHLCRSLRDTVGCDLSSLTLRYISGAHVFAGIVAYQGDRLAISQISLGAYSAGLCLRLALLRKSWKTHGDESGGSI